MKPSGKKLLVRSLIAVWAAAFAVSAVWIAAPFFSPPRKLSEVVPELADVRLTHAAAAQVTGTGNGTANREILAEWESFLSTATVTVSGWGPGHHFLGQTLPNRMIFVRDGGDPLLLWYWPDFRYGDYFYQFSDADREKAEELYRQLLQDDLPDPIGYSINTGEVFER